MARAAALAAGVTLLAAAPAFGQDISINLGEDAGDHRAGRCSSSG
jgi:hypothetical protein